MYYIFLHFSWNYDLNFFLQATGFEVDGGLLRYQLYIWLEREVEALKQLTNYGKSKIFLFFFVASKPWDLKFLVTSKMSTYTVVPHPLITLPWKNPEFKVWIIRYAFIEHSICMKDSSDL